jgi:hypothetical protein
MLRFVTDYTRPDGLAPQIGDADNGRLLPLEDYGSTDQRSHLHLFRQAGLNYRPARVSAAYPDGGFFILRSGDLYAAVRCGDVGIYGRGCHAHNDLLAFELCWRSTPVVVDPGAYLYTADPLQRNRFRSTSAHSTLQIDDREQNEVYADRLFAMADRARPELLTWSPGSMTVFQGRHRGFADASDRCLHTRTLRLGGATGTLELIDEVSADRPHDLTWRFPLAPCEAETDDGLIRASFSDFTLIVSGEQLEVDLESGYLSPQYGTRVSAPVVRLRGRSQPGLHRATITLSIAAR